MHQSRHSDRGWRKTMVLARPKISPRRATCPSNTLSATKSANSGLMQCSNFGGESTRQLSYEGSALIFAGVAGDYASKDPDNSTNTCNANLSIASDVGAAAAYFDIDQSLKSPFAYCSCRSTGTIANEQKRCSSSNRPVASCGDYCRAFSRPPSASPQA